MNTLYKRQSLAEKFFSEKENFSSAEFYKLLFDNFSPEEAQELVFTDFGEKFFPEKIQQKIQQFSPEIFSYFTVPAVSVHAEKFLPFFKEQKIYSIVEKFQKSFPEKIFYRAAVLTPKQAKNIQENGFLSAFLRTEKKYFSEFSEPLHRRIAKHAYSNIQTNNSLLISVSPSQELAKFIAYRFFLSQKNKLKNEELFLYTFPVRLRESELIPSEPFLPPEYKNSYLIHSSEKGTYNIPFADAEYWMEYSIPPEKIDTNNIKRFDIGDTLHFKQLSL